MKYWRKLSRWQKAGVIVAIFLVAQVVTYLWRAEAIMPQSALRHLSDYVLIEDSNYVIFDSDMWESLSNSQKKVLRKEVTKYVSDIYYSKDEVPDSKKHFRKITQEEKEDLRGYIKSGEYSGETLKTWKQQLKTGRKLLSLKNGLALSWKLNAHWPFWMKCKASWWSSGTGGEWSSEPYIWVLGWWVPIHIEGHAMS